MQSMCQLLCKKDPVCQAARFNIDSTNCDFFRIPLYSETVCEDDYACSSVSTAPYAKNTHYCAQKDCTPRKKMCINPDILIGEPIHKKQEADLEMNTIVETECTNGLSGVNVFDEVYSNEICYQKTGSQFIGAGVCRGKENEPIWSRAVTSVRKESECEQMCRQTYGCQGFMYTDRSAYKINGATEQDIENATNGDNVTFGTPANILWQCHHFIHPHFPAYNLSQAAAEFVYPDCFTNEGNCNSKTFIESTDADLMQQPFLCFRLSIYFPKKFHTTQTNFSDLATVEDTILHKFCEPGYIEGTTSGNGNIIDPCDPNPCKNEGTCKQDDTDGYTCECQSGDVPGGGYAGKNCELICGAVYWPSPYAYKFCCPDITNPWPYYPIPKNGCQQKECLNCLENSATFGFFASNYCSGVLSYECYALFIIITPN